MYPHSRAMDIFNIAHYLIRHAVEVRDARGYGLSDRLEDRKWNLVEWMGKYGLLNHHLTDGVVMARLGPSETVVYRVCHADGPTIVTLPVEGYEYALGCLPTLKTLPIWGNAKLIGIEPEWGGGSGAEEFKARYAEAIDWLAGGAKHPTVYVAELFNKTAAQVEEDLKKRS